MKPTNTPKQPPPIPAAVPAALTRPRNGGQSGNGLNVDQHNDPSGGGKVTSPFTSAQTPD